MINNEMISPKRTISISEAEKQSSKGTPSELSHESCFCDEGCLQDLFGAQPKDERLNGARGTSNGYGQCRRAGLLARACMFLKRRK